MNRPLQVKVSPYFPSPVNAKKGTKLHPQHANNQLITGEGEGWRQKLRTRWVRDAQARVRLGALMRARATAHGGVERKKVWLCSKRSGVWSERSGESKESPQVFISTSLQSKNKTILPSKTSQVRNKIVIFAIDKTHFSLFTVRFAASI